MQSYENPFLAKKNEQAFLLALLIYVL